MPGFVAREVLLAPDLVARAAMVAVSDPAQRWMLGQPRAVRSSYAHQVLDRGGHEREQQIWMLRQPDAVRGSYVREVAMPQGAGKQTMWMLGQPDAVRESYVREVLGGR
jgi:hypothetical protein